MDYSKTLTPTVRVGLVLPTNLSCETYFIFILDANNRLWYADRKDIFNDGECIDFRIVYFRENNDEDEELRNCASSILYGVPIHKHKAKNIKACHYLEHVENISFDHYCENDFYGIRREDIFEKSESFNFCISHGGWYNECGIVTFSLSLSESSDEKVKRMYVIDKISKTYRLLNIETGRIFDKLLNERTDTHLIIDWDEVYNIYKTVSNFNPYEVFESYRIEIEHYVQSRIGKDNYYYEYKTYYIKYIDEYLKKWFLKKKELLYTDSGYTSNFVEVNPYKRFVDEEYVAKEIAYKEYSKFEHFDSLMRQYYKTLYEHINSIYSNSARVPYKWIDDELHLKKAYACLNSLWGHAVDSYIPRQKKDFESSIESGLIKFNITDCKLE
jgi:hypothetical protein